MVTIDLITGFLGSGKTTFMKEYARYLMDCGYRIGILENDYGAVNVDMLLLQELMGEKCELEMVSGGCDRDCHRRRFQTKLIAMGMCGYDRVLVEPSGIYDVDEFFDVLQEEPLSSWYRIGNVIAIVDAGAVPDLSRESDYLLASEAANAGIVLLSKAAHVKENDIEAVRDHLNRALEQIFCKRKIRREEIVSKDWKLLTAADWKQIISCGYRPESWRKENVEESGVFSSLYFMNRKLTKAALMEATQQILNDPDCGQVHRVKGFIRTAEEGWLELNAAAGQCQISPIETGQEILIAIGEKLNEKKIDQYLQKKDSHTV